MNTELIKIAYKIKNNDLYGYDLNLPCQYLMEYVTYALTKSRGNVIVITTKRVDTFMRRVKKRKLPYGVRCNVGRLLRVLSKYGFVEKHLGVYVLPRDRAWSFILLLRYLQYL